MRIHLIATGGAVMHNLALALQQNGHQVSGSDDEIYNPARDRLATAGLLPPAFGWFPEKITAELDFVILGMHARADNPELARALGLGLKVYSFPEFIYEHAKNKTRVVVAGSHGKTTTTAMIMHALRLNHQPFDYLVGAQLEGFDTMVKLSDAPVMVIEGDEYLSSPIDRRPKFLHYRPHLVIITGISWDHVNVFPVYDDYKRQFTLLLESMEPNGHLLFYNKDKDLTEIVRSCKSNIYATPYTGLAHEIYDGKVWIRHLGDAPVQLRVFGEHNLANLHAAQLACHDLGIKEADFLEAAASFTGAAKRLQLLTENDHFAAWLDFAHAPSKAQATVKAVRHLYPYRRLVACFELHTFSSLNKNFLSQYAGTMNGADVACVFYSPHTLAMKKLEPLEPSDIRAAFGFPGLQVFTEWEAMAVFLEKQDWKDANLLLMSSGTFGGGALKELAIKLSAA
jgi:UDP-N-acetylmuramate: L-alanyl-gamma-D-glutamyl-meso-diaminopimelate ligase